MKLQKRTLGQWQELMDEQVKSGLNGQRWCKEKGITYGAFTSAVKRLHKKIHGGTLKGNNIDGKWIELQISNNCSKEVSPGGVCASLIELLIEF